MSAYRFADGSSVPSKYIRYACPSCEDVHKTYDGARECCEPCIDTVSACPICDKVHSTAEGARDCHANADPTELPATGCPVCHEMHDAIDRAVECCLWKTHDIGQRLRLANRLATSAINPIWNEQICSDFGITLRPFNPEEEDTYY